MQTLLKTLTAVGLVLSLGMLSVPEASAKDHDQGLSSPQPGTTADPDPGVNVGSETVGAAQDALGANQGKESGAGNSEKAGRGGPGAAAGAMGR